MLVREVQNQFRNSNADVQIFYGTSQGGGNTMATWNKPPGVSHVYMMLIGPGGSGDGIAGFGGGSGAVTVWYGSAQNVPDSLEILCHGVGTSANTEIRYRTTSSSTNQLLVARTGSSTTGGPTSPANTFGASGFYQSVAGQDGSSGAITASATTFLCGGGYSGTGTANYGYRCRDAGGYFMLQPVIVGVAIAANTGGTKLRTGVGCGGSGVTSSDGGPGMVLIASW